MKSECSYCFTSTLKKDLKKITLEYLIFHIDVYSKFWNFSMQKPLQFLISQLKNVYESWNYVYLVIWMSHCRLINHATISWSQKLQFSIILFCAWWWSWCKVTSTCTFHNTAELAPMLETVWVGLCKWSYDSAATFAIYLHISLCYAIFSVQLFEVWFWVCRMACFKNRNGIGIPIFFKSILKRDELNFKIKTGNISTSYHYEKWFHPAQDCMLVLYRHSANDADLDNNLLW